MGWVPSCKPKGHQFNSQWGHVPEFQDWSQVRNQSVFLSPPMFLSLSFSLPSLLSKIKILRINKKGALLAFSESCGHSTLSLKVLSLSRAPQTPVPATLSFITRPGVLLSLLFKCSLRFLFLVPLAAFGRTPGRKRGSNFEQPPSHQTFFRPVVAQPRVY